MSIRRTMLCRVILLSILVLAGGSGLVFAQGGTGKMPPLLRTPPPMHRTPMPIPRTPPPRKSLPPEKGKVVTDILVVPRTSAGPLSTAERLPAELGQFKRNKLDTSVSDFTNEDYGAVEVVRAEYGKDILIFLSQFKDAASANNTMQALAKKAAGSHNTVSRKRLKNRSGQSIGEFWLMKSSGKEKKAYLLVTNTTHLYRVNGTSTDDVQKVFKSLPLE